MATIPNNILQNVRTYCDAKLGALQNQNCFIGSLNTKYKTFQDLPANLGDTVNIETPYRATTVPSLVASFEGTDQPLQPLTCDQAISSSHAFTSQQFLFNAEQYMDKFGMARVRAIGAAIESSAALTATSSVPVMQIVNGQSIPTGALHTESGPYLFYGDGQTPINSFGQLALIEAYMRNFGAPMGELKTYLDDISVANIINTGQNQFVLERNDKLSNSWDLGSYKGSNSRYYKSNLLPIHIAGSAGQNQDTLTLVSTNDPTGANITQLTFSGVSVNANAVLVGDLIQFDVSSGLVYLTWEGYKPSKNLVQVRVTASEDGIAGTVAVDIFPALQSTNGLNKNLNIPLAAGMTAKAQRSHRAGLVVGGDAYYLAMPPLPDERPFDTYTSTDPQTKVSLRNYFGSQFGQNQRGFVSDGIWGLTAVPQYTRRILFPIIG
jgi:hypothetical protein